MKILKTKTFFTYLVVGALVMALSISCKSYEEPSTFKLSDLAGTWRGDAGSFTIDSSGTIEFTYQGTTYSRRDELGLEAQFMSVAAYESGYDIVSNPLNGGKRKYAYFSFNSSSSCEVSIGEDTYSGTYPYGSWKNTSENPIGTFTK